MTIKRMIARFCLLAALLSIGAIVVGVLPESAIAKKRHHSVDRVLLISIDGLHAADLARYVESHPHSTLAFLSSMGVTYANASATKPSDSFPGLLALVTGGTPRSTGVFYDDSYDRSLSPPGSDCSTVGAEIVYDESIDKNPSALDAGGGIDPAQLPRDPAHGCVPVYPHSFLRVNTIFEVIKAAGMRTAWSDKHPAYDLVNGPSGAGVDDLYTPEIASDCPLPGASGDNTTSIACVEQYDDIKVQAIVNEAQGFDHTGKVKTGIPAIFGMNFQTVSVAQKLAEGSYTDGSYTPSAGLGEALDHTDHSLFKITKALGDQGLLESTLIIITAKHGQAPVDLSLRQIVSSKLISSIVNSVQPDLVAQATQDDVGLIWLTHPEQTNAVVAALRANQKQAGIQETLSGAALKLLFNDPRTDPRSPDIIVEPNLGVIYTKPTATKTAEHGGFSDQDTNVALLVVNPLLKQTVISVPVQTTQVAPTILSVLGIDPMQLAAVRQEQTPRLVGFELGSMR